MLRTDTGHDVACAERGRPFLGTVKIHPGFEHYRRWAGRPIPVLRLEPRS